MNKIILGLICFLAIACNNINGQCTPNLTGPSGNIVPDSTVGLPHDTVGQTYSAVIQVFVPADTIYQSQNVPIDSFVLNSINGMPAGFTYSCFPTNCSFPGNSAGCVLITGPTATNTMVGTYPLTIHLTAWVTVIILGHPVPYADALTITDFRIIIDSASSAGIAVVSTPKNFEVYQNSPNPVNGVSEIDYYSPANAKITFKVVNVLGSIVQNKVLDAKAGMNQIYISSKDIAVGVYMYTISNGTQTVTKRMVVGNR
jgi:hypothetical protein